MEDVALDCLNNDNIFREVNLLYAFYSYPSENNQQDSPGTHDPMMNIYQKLMHGYITT